MTLVDASASRVADMQRPAHQQLEISGTLRQRKGISW
jgi:hypothetical protein